MNILLYMYFDIIKPYADTNPNYKLIMKVPKEFW